MARSRWASRETGFSRKVTPGRVAPFGSESDGLIVVRRFFGAVICAVALVAALGAGQGRAQSDGGTTPIADLQTAAAELVTDPEKALKVIEPAARAGVAEAQFLLAIAYRDGLGRGADARLSREWFGKAAEQGHGPAAVVLAEDALQSGQSEVATKWIEAAMSAGESRGFALKAESLRANDPGSAAVFLGVALGLGDAQAGLALADLALASAPPDPGAARSALAQAAALGSARALARLGIAYRDGFGTAPDPVVAFALLQEALSLGDPEGARALGEMMSAEDAGYWRNPSLGLAYCLWAIKSLDGANCDEIRAGLSAQEIAEGEALAKDF